MPANLNEIEKRLWDAADELRANSKLKASEYGDPVLGLIFLRYADARFTEAKKRLEGSVTRRRGQLSKHHYQVEGVVYVPEEARFSHLLHLPESEELGRALNDAMRLIEDENEDLRRGAGRPAPPRVLRPGPWLSSGASVSAPRRRFVPSSSWNWRSYPWPMATNSPSNISLMPTPARAAAFTPRPDRRSCTGAPEGCGSRLPRAPPRQAAAGQGFGGVDAGGVGGGGERDREFGAGEEDVRGAG